LNKLSGALSDRLKPVTTNNPVEPSTSGALPDFAECWRRMPHKAAFGLLLAAWVALFHWLGNSTFGYTDTASLFGWLKYCYSMKAEEEHVFVVPFVVLFLLWWKRETLLEVPKRFWGVALILLAAAALLHIAGYVVQQTRISFLGFILGLYALSGIVWGAKWLRAISFPFFLLVFCMPLGTSAEMITFPLRMIVTQLSVGISQYGLGIDVIRNGTQIFDSTQTFQYDVAPACSGIRSLVALLAMATIYGVIGFGKTWKTILIVCSAVPLAVLGNTARITTVILVAKVAGHDAGTMIEQKFGFITFVVSIAGMLLLGYLIRDRKPSSLSPEAAAAITPERVQQVAS
jgi:exosortase